MIATGLTFLLGVLLTALFALLIAPIVWRKAQTLARREYDATIPASANEIRAEFDRVRAEAALSIRRQEILTAKANEKAARTQAELGRGTVENVEILRKVRGLTQTVQERDVEIARMTELLTNKTAEAERLSAELAAAQSEARFNAEELDALSKRFVDLGEIAEERKIQLIAADAKLDRLADAGRLAERSQRASQEVIDRLRGDLAAAERLVASEKAALTEMRAKQDAMISTLADRDEEIAVLKLKAPDTASGKPLVLPAPSASVVPGTAAQRLRAALDGKKGGADEDSAPDAASDAELRETISALAARVIRIAALAEGPHSPLAGLLKADATLAGETPSLAERVRMLADAERVDNLPGRVAAQARPE